MKTNEDLTPEHSIARNGKSFHWAGRFLGREVGRDATRLYSFCRILDDMADGDIPNGPRRLKNIRSGLIDATVTNDLLLPYLTAFMYKKDISTEIMVALIDGLIQDQRAVSIADERALLRYSYRVAGTVGVMMSTIFGCTDRSALSHAVDLGIAMQLTNIARDVLEDASMGRRYIPATWVGDMAPTAILAAANDQPSYERDTMSTAVARLLQLAETYYESGTKGLVYLPPRAHLAIAVAAQVYRQIGAQIAVAGHQWYNGREITNRLTKFTCSVKAIRSLSLRSRSFPGHHSALHDTLVGLPHVQ